MNTNKLNYFGLISEIWQVLSSKRKFQFWLLSFLFLITSFSEVVNISLLKPLLSFLEGEENYEKLKYLNKILDFLQISNTQNITKLIFIAFILSIFLSTFLKLLSSRLTLNFTAILGNDFSKKLYNKNLNQPYEYLVQQNSSKFVALVSADLNGFVRSVDSLLRILSSIIVSVSIILFLLYSEPKITTIAFLSIFICYLVLGKYLKPILSKNSKILSRNAQLQFKSLQEGVGSIRDIIIDGSQFLYVNHYGKLNYQYRKSQAQNNFWKIAPKTIIEALIILLITLLGFFITNNSSSSNTVISLGFLAFSAQKLIPAIQRIFNGWTSINSQINQINKVLNSLKINEIEVIKKNKLNSLNFEKKIEIIDVFFKYQNTDNFVLKKLNLTIEKGDCVGICGVSGAGKSTFVDLVMGLLKPSSGKILIDGVDIYADPEKELYKSWRVKIAHVPQSIFLADTTIAKNIAMSLPYSALDINKVKEAAKRAQLSSFIESLQFGYETIVGERGVFLSGGQRQRLGIARAIYKDAEILILDEATSALDSKTENSLMSNIDLYAKGLTTFIIAHRLSTLKNCTKLIEIKNKDLILKIKN